MSLETYLFVDDGRFPNSPLPVLVHRSALPADAERIESHFAANGWGGAWGNGIYRYHHFHSTAHEVLGIAAGWTEVLFGGPAGRAVTVQAGDAIVIPAGVAHRNLDQGTDLLVVGAYPGGMTCDLCRGNPANHAQAMQAVGRVPLPDRDPVHGAGIWDFP